MEFWQRGASVGGGKSRGSILKGQRLLLPTLNCPLLLAMEKLQLLSFEMQKLLTRRAKN